MRRELLVFIASLLIPISSYASDYYIGHVWSGRGNIKTSGIECYLRDEEKRQLNITVHGKEKGEVTHLYLDGLLMKEIVGVKTPHYSFGTTAGFGAYLHSKQETRKIKILNEELDIPETLLNTNPLIKVNFYGKVYDLEVIAGVTYNFDVLNTEFGLGIHF